MLSIALRISFNRLFDILNDDNNDLIMIINIYTHIYIYIYDDDNSKVNLVKIVVEKLELNPFRFLTSFQNKRIS